MNPVARDDDVAVNHCAVGECNPCRAVILYEAGATVAGVHHVWTECACELFDKIGAMHPECGVPARSVGHLDRRDRCPVMAEVMRAGTNPGSMLLDQGPQSHPLQ